MPLPLVKRKHEENSSARLNSTSTKRRKILRPNSHHGPPRPRTPVSYTLPQQRQRKDPQNGSPSQNERFETFARVKRLSDLIFRRNKNQHRSQPFWKQFSFLRRSLARLEDVENQLVNLDRLPKSLAGRDPKSDAPAGVLADSASVSIRRRFETERRLRTERDAVETHVREILVPNCYVAFSALVQDSQFANLGVVLTGLLAEVAGRIVGMMKRVEKPPVPASVVSSLSSKSRLEGGGRGAKSFSTNTNGSRHDDGRPDRYHGGGEGKEETGSEIDGVRGTSLRVTGIDQGEVVERWYDSDGVEKTIGPNFDVNPELEHEREHETAAGKDEDDGDTEHAALRSGNGRNAKDSPDFSTVVQRKVDDPAATFQREERERERKRTLDIESRDTVADKADVKPKSEAEVGSGSDLEFDREASRSKSKSKPKSKSKSESSSRTKSTRNATGVEKPIKTYGDKAAVGKEVIPKMKTVAKQEADMKKKEKEKKKGKGKGNAIDDLFSGLF